MTIIIPYTGNQHGLSQLLVALQPQLHPDDDIYIIDTTKDLSGVKLGALYGSTRCFVFVETAPGISFEEAVERGIESMRQNKQEGALVITPRCVITSTFIANMKKAAKLCNHYILYPQFLHALHEIMDANFAWYGSSQTKIVEVDSSETDPQCYYQRNGVNQGTIGVVENETIAVLP